MKTKKVFISFIEENSDIAEQVWDRLTEEGFMPWAYTKNGSAKWKKQVVRELQQCDIMILIFSKKTDDKADKQIVKELGLASEYEKEIIPFMIDEISPNDIKTEEIAYEVVGGNITWVGKEIPLEKQIETLLTRIKNYYNEDDIPILKNEKKPEQTNKSFPWKYFMIPVFSALVLLGYFGYTEFFEKKNSTQPIISGEESKQPKRILTPNQSHSNIPTLSVTNKRKSSKRWAQSIHVDSTEILSFELHYYTDYSGAINLHVFLDDLRGKVLDENQSIKVHGKITSDNLDPALGEVEVTFDEAVELQFHRISWQKWPCQEISCEEPIKDNINNLFNGKGLYLGDVPKDGDYYSGNLVVEFKAVAKNTISNNSKNEDEFLTPNMDDNVNTLQVGFTKGSHTSWHPSAYINSSMQLSFNLHYNTKYMGAKNLKAFLGSLNNKVYRAGEEVEVQGVLTADMLEPAKGKVKITFEEDVKILFKSVSWQVWPCQKVECETEIKGNINDLFSEQGLLIGDLDKNNDSHYSGNIVVSYKVIKVSEK